MRILPADPGLLIVSCDGAARGNPGPAGIGVQITDEDGNVVAEIAEWIGETTNNVAEYTAALEGLRRAGELGARRVHLRSDSQLLIQQLAGRYKVKASHLRPLHAEVMGLLSGFDGCGSSTCRGSRTARPIGSRTSAWTSGARARRAADHRDRVDQVLQRERRTSWRRPGPPATSIRRVRPSALACAGNVTIPSTAASDGTRTERRRDFSGGRDPCAIRIQQADILRTRARRASVARDLQEELPVGHRHEGVDRRRRVPSLDRSPSSPTISNVLTERDAVPREVEHAPRPAPIVEEQSHGAVERPGERDHRPRSSGRNENVIVGTHVDLAEERIRSRDAGHLERRGGPDLVALDRRRRSSRGTRDPGCRTNAPSASVDRRSTSRRASRVGAGVARVRAHERGGGGAGARRLHRVVGRAPGPAPPGWPVRRATGCRRSPRARRRAAAETDRRRIERAESTLALGGAGVPLAAVCSRTEEPAGRPRSIFGSVEESPDSAGQGAGETQAGVTSRKAQQRTDRRARSAARGKGETVR